MMFVPSGSSSSTKTWRTDLAVGVSVNGCISPVMGSTEDLIDPPPPGILVRISRLDV